MTDLESSNPAADRAMDRYAAGDASAFSEVYDALSPRLYSFALAKTRNPARAEDLVQQAMLRIHCARGRFVAGSRVTPWAIAIVKNLFLDQARRKKIEVPAANGYPDTSHPCACPGPEDRFQAKQGELLVRRALAELPRAQQNAFELVYYAQMSVEEAAEVLGTTVASVKARVFRAKESIRAALDAWDAAGPSR